MPTFTSLPEKWKLEFDSADGTIDLIEFRTLPEGQEDDELVRIKLGHIDGNTDSKVPNYYPTGHAVYDRIDDHREDWETRETQDDYESEHNYTYQKGQTG